MATIARLARLSIAAAALSVMSLCAQADAPLSISLSRPLPASLAAVMGTGRYIYLDGDVDLQAGRRLEEFIKANDLSPTSIVVLNSPGGSLVGGMELGKVIRKYGLTSNVGKRVVRDGRDSVDPGQCMSACTMAFIGGRFRYLTKGSRFGVHRFYFETAGVRDADIAQVISAAVVNYIREMGIDLGLFTLTTKAGRDEILELERATLESLEVLNNGIGRTAWTIEGRSGLLYLKGERDTVYGINKFIVLCGSGNAILHMIFDPQGRQEEAMGLAAHSLVVDLKDEPITPAGRQITNGWFNAQYPLTKSQTRRLASASSVGVMVRGSYDSPIFLGFNAMPVQGAEERVRSFLTGCIKR